MFIASLVICAAVNGQIIPDRCFGLKDTRGPYRTEQACEDRLVEMERTVDEDPQMIAFLSSMLGGPPSIGIKGICERPDNGEVEV